MPSLLDDIHAHPQAVRALVAWYRAAGYGRLEAWAARMRAAGRVRFVGMGTSHYVTEVIAARFAAGGVEVSAVDAGEVLYYPRPSSAPAVCISQSGESVETRRVAERLHGSVPLCALTNDPASSIARRAEVILPMQAGEEGAVAAKTYVNSMAVLSLLACALEGRIDDGFAALASLADMMGDCDVAAIERAAALLHAAPAVHTIARGPAYAAARQCAQTLMEGARLSATAFTGAGFRHGPFELAGEGHAAIVFIPAGVTAGLLITLAAELVQRGSRVVAITNAPLELPGERAVVLRLPAVDEALFPLLAAPTQERLLVSVARARGVEPGDFRYGGKVTLHE